MSATVSFTTTSVFTLTHARYLTSKIAADLHLCNLYYDKPSQQHIENLAEELALLLKDGYVKSFDFGFESNNTRIFSVQYDVCEDGTIKADDDPGSIISSANLTGNENFFNFLTYSEKWERLSLFEKEEIKKILPIKRTIGDPPAIGSGCWTYSDKSYNSGGVGIKRSTYRAY
ncbi:MAG: hypothetical protein HYV27_06060 [Candidatus Hydrogenedentes bacterium]|nr:hypothetical protein [Candidatus Hydrogenedentota bacterium]